MLIDLSAARSHLRLEDDYPAEQLTIYIGAAAGAAADFLNRRIFANETERAAAILAVPAMLVTAVATRDLAVAAAGLVADLESRAAMLEDADITLRAARAAAVEIRRGIVIDDTVRAAVRLILGHLFKNRADTAEKDASEIPMGSRSLLQPYRIGLGV